MKTHDNRVLFSKALLKAATCLFLTAGAGMSPVFALPGTAESMKMEITQQTVTVSGVVKDKKGEPIIGATLYPPGSSPSPEVLTSFVLPIHNQGVSFAPLLGLALW